MSGRWVLLVIAVLISFNMSINAYLLSTRPTLSQVKELVDDSIRFGYLCKEVNAELDTCLKVIIQ